MRLLRIGSTTIELHDDDLTVTVLPDGSRVDARPQDTDDYRNRALYLGYGDDTASMSRQHEIAHALLAELLGLECSPTMQGVASGKHWNYWREEEAAALSLAAFANAAGVSLLNVAMRRHFDYSLV